MMVMCLRCPNKSAREYRLKYPQPDSTPPVMRWEAPGPRLWMCDDCGAEARDWAQPAEAQ